MTLTDSPIFSADDAARQIRELQAEINLLRRRDDTLKFYMTRLDEEMRLAARLQQDFLPKSLPQLGPVKFHTLFRPAHYVSGDIYDVMRLDEHHLGFFIGDAVGHGMPAALLTLFLKRALVSKEILPGGYRLPEPHETIGRLNDAMVEQELSPSTFATAIYGVIDTRSLTVSFACAGHPSPVLLRGERLEDLSARGGLLGLIPGEIYVSTSLTLQPGDRLIVYSDGVEVAFTGDVEDENSGAPAPGDERWRAELLQRRELGADEMLIGFSRAIDDEVGSLSPRDDLTMILLEVS